MEEIMPMLTETTVTILTALLALAAAYAVRWVNAATTKVRIESTKIEDDQFREFADEALARVDDLATKTVTQLEQTTAQTLRELVRSGAVSRKELEALGTRAVDEVIYNLSPSYRDAITETVGDLREYVTKAVETKVYQLKNGLALLPADGVEVVV